MTRQDAEGSEDFAAALEQFEREQQQEGAGPRVEPKVGDRVTGRIVSIGADSAFVELGGKGEGILDLAELRGEDGELTANVGDSLEAVVTAGEEGGPYTLRIKAGGKGRERRSREAPAEIRAAFEARLPVEGMVTAVVKGGVSVEVAGARAFCPISQLDRRFVEDPNSYVGRRLTFKISRCEPGQRGLDLVLSRRAFLEEEAKSKAAEMKERLKVGSVVHGTVSSLTRYGAFVDLGGVDGLLHVSEMSHSRVERPDDVVAVGQEFDVLITKVEPGPGGQDRISLSLKGLAPDPWSLAVDHFPVGEAFAGRIARLQAFGAFVELSPGIDGLLHISELAPGRRINHPSEVVEVGQNVAVRVLAVDPARRRISLTLAGDPADAIGWEEEPMV